MISSEILANGAISPVNSRRRLRRCRENSMSRRNSITFIRYTTRATDSQTLPRSLRRDLRQGPGYGDLPAQQRMSHQ